MPEHQTVLNNYCGHNAKASHLGIKIDELLRHDGACAAQTPKVVCVCKYMQTLMKANERCRLPRQLSTFTFFILLSLFSITTREKSCYHRFADNQEEGGGNGLGGDTGSDDDDGNEDDAEDMAIVE